MEKNTKYYLDSTWESTCRNLGAMTINSQSKRLGCMTNGLLAQGIHDIPRSKMNGGRTEYVKSESYDFGPESV